VQIITHVFKVFYSVPEYVIVNTSVIEPSVLFV